MTEKLLLLWHRCARCYGAFYAPVHPDFDHLVQVPIIPGLCPKCVSKDFVGLSAVDEFFKRLKEEEH